MRSWRKGWIPRTWLMNQTREPNVTHVIDKKPQRRGRSFWRGLRDMAEQREAKYQFKKFS